MSLISETKVIDVVERFSLKYTNVIPSEFGGASSVVNLTLKIGPNDSVDKTFQTRVEIPKDNLISIVQIANEGTVTLPDGTTKTGILVDIDTISMAKDLPFAAFFETLSEQLEITHTEAKAIFFSCLRPDLIDKLEPNYG